MRPSALVATIEYLQAALSLAGSHNLGVAIAQLDLTHRPARRVELAKNDRRAIPSAPRRPAGARIAAAPDLDSRHLGIEVRFERRLVSISCSLDRCLAHVREGRVRGPR
jgi:hypothetical protein